MNLIPKIAELLGVEIGEEFKFSADDDIKHKFSEGGLMYESLKQGEWKLEQHYTFYRLLRGDLEIINLPFEPKEGDAYYFMVLTTKELTISRTIFNSNSTIDLMRKYCGNCFRTEAEAEKHKYEVYEKLTGKKWEE